MPERQFGTTNRVALRYVKETEYNVTPTSPALQTLRFTGESLNFGIETEVSDEIRSDRMTSDIIQMGAMVEGDVNGELSYATYDDFILGALKAATGFATPTPISGTDISIDEGVGGLWELNSGATDLNPASPVPFIDQMIKVVRAGVTFYGRVASVADNKIEFYPLSVITEQVAGTSISVTFLSTLRNGVTQHTFTFQKAFLDLAVPKFYNLKGCAIGKMEVDIASKAKLGVTFSVMGGEGDQVETQFAGATIVNPNTNPIMSASRNVAVIAIDNDVATPYYFTKCKLSLDNAERARDAIGSFYPVSIVPGRIQPTMDIEIYLEDKTLFDKFKNNQSVSITIPILDSNGQGYIIHMPRCKFTSQEETAGGIDQDVFVSGNLQALVNTANTYEIQISKAV